MKQVFLILTMAFSMSAQARTFTPESGMKFLCNDNVSGLAYHLAIKDIGDETGIAKVSNKERILEIYTHVAFEENSYGSYFVIWPTQGGEPNDNSAFAIRFPKNNLKKAYYEDGGDSRPVQCKIINY